MAGLTVEGLLKDLLATVPKRVDMNLGNAFPNFDQALKGVDLSFLPFIDLAAQATQPHQSNGNDAEQVHAGAEPRSDDNGESFPWQEKWARDQYLQRLRPNRGDSAAMTTYLDQDDSEDYDPELSDSEGQMREIPLQDLAVRKTRNKERAEGWAAAWEECLARCHEHNHTRCTSVVRLKLPKDTLETWTITLPDKWPTRACLQREIDKAFLWKTGGDISVENIVETDLRPRSKASDDQKPDEWIGRPEYNGCWACLGHEECSLRTLNPRKWPCDACAVNKTECEMIRPPARKRQCETCRTKKKERCSFVADSEMAGPCGYCQANNIKCIAGPTSDGFPKRYLCQAPGQGPRPARFDEARSNPRNGLCSICEAENYSCSLGAPDGQLPKTAKPPCTNCKYESLQCDGLPLMKVEKRSNKGKRKRDITEGEATDTKGNKSERPPSKRISSNAITSKTINDRDAASDYPLDSRVNGDGENRSDTYEDSGDELFVNPRSGNKTQPVAEPLAARIMITSNPHGTQLLESSRLYRPIRPNSEPCALCTSVKYAVLGKAYITPVKDWQTTDRTGTTICKTCTVLRIAIRFCKYHDMVPFGDGETRNVTFQDMMDRLLKDKTKTDDPWCSICPTPASHRCQGDKMDGGLECGLVLCQQCVKNLRISKGDLQTMLEAVPTTKTRVRPFGTRADSELLKDGGGLDGLL
ncbi:hypothetical protein CAC42_4988 [Sphaceloma murrayae]|uniref:Zn(2)-C6 fungal-type domain-containing protein n=1 Tax=Sphaceloma murrayae TaxID=2082308 RepID=A0A2K1QPJ6_9PEZI|nr:hypothetical protein CAC42_4988 [Sphaceloma murrayae]